ncbi:GGDEF and EAL domain-containing protein [Hartmannibacter diazotrophicus]|uniref:GGDEF and EAL domain-containing protein n=1 Tax=Hartmannibacter diazotrophicus TaxID=1482074 RepID=UPI001390524A|nr:GGDEF and EAL domain-containing protein [Hartmannibacter diazotrophicus]
MVGTHNLNEISSDVWMKEIFEASPDYLFVKDRQSRFLAANPSLLGGTPFKSVDEILGKTDFDFHEPSVAKGYYEQEQAIMEAGLPKFNFEESFVDDNGRTNWLLTTKIPLHAPSGDVIGLVGICRNITERKRAEELQQGQAGLLEMIALGEPVDRILEKLVRLIEDQLPNVMASLLFLDKTGKRLRRGVSIRLPEAWSALIDGAEIGPGVGSCGTAAWSGERVLVDDIRVDPLWKDYRELAEPFGFRSCWSTPVLSPEGEVLGTFALYSDRAGLPDAWALELMDIASHLAGIALGKKYTEERIHFIALHDSLTGLPNRAGLKERIETAVEKARVSGGGVLAAYVDVDHFKTVNDSLGHGAGDEALRAVARRLSDALAPHGAVFRMGGDEFLVILEDRDPECADAWKTLQSIHVALRQPVSAGGADFSVTCSIGAAAFPTDANNSETLLSHADTALYRAKNFGRDNCQRFSASMAVRTGDRLSMQEDLRLAVERNELRLFFQPQADLRSGRIFAVEALVRWQHPKKGLLPPGLFIPLAEETGLINEIGKWVIEEACRQNRAWQDEGLPAMAVSVNVSARQFREPYFVNVVRSILLGCGLDPRRLEIEITESMIMQDLTRAVETMRELADLGVTIAIDDFGTGYSSLSALKSFPVSRLKIDRSFIAELPNDESDAAITSAVISMAQKLNLKVIAEGVETIAQAEFLREAGCHDIQGYLVSRPVQAAKIADIIRWPRQSDTRMPPVGFGAEPVVSFAG